PGNGHSRSADPRRRCGAGLGAISDCGRNAHRGDRHRRVRGDVASTTLPVERLTAVPHRRAAIRGVVLGLVAALLGAGSTMAALSASVANLTLPGVTFSHTAQTNTGTMTLTASDTGPIPLGWNVTIQ